MHIAIAGNIGAGKTTLTGLLAKHYNWDTHFEDVDENPIYWTFMMKCNDGPLIFKFTISIVDLHKPKK